MIENLNITPEDGIIEIYIYREVVYFSDTLPIKSPILILF